MSRGGADSQRSERGRAERTAPLRSGPPFIGLTGGIGAGKSTALAALGRLGAWTISADAVVHELYRDSDALRAALVSRWGEQIMSGGSIDRDVVAAHVFAEPGERHWLEQQIWPLVGERIARFRREGEAATPRPRALVVETPLLFEAGMESAYDATIAIVADEPLRAGRAAARGHVAVDERAARQLSQAEKAQRATFVVRNDAGEAELEAELSAVLARLGC